MDQVVKKQEQQASVKQGIAKQESVAVLGSTGSIGKSTLAVIDQNPDRYRVYALCANTDVAGIYAQIQKYRPRYAAMANDDAAEKLLKLIHESDIDTEVLAGASSLVTVAAHKQVDTLVAAIVGSAGLPSTMSAVNAGKKVLLANKETLVCGGRLVMDAVSSSGAKLLPVDSEHNAIFQCLPEEAGSLDGVSKIYLTGSGGPFRGRSLADLADITPDQACAHPNWSMGRKISVDSATMMNKGLELIEACWLFDLPVDMIDIVIHPQSIIHSMVEYSDGSVLAQLGSPDMKTPIAHALAWPDRIASGSKPFDIFTSKFTFDKPDFSNYPCLELALEAADKKESAPLVLNASNEIAVASFLERQIGYTDIPLVVKKVLTEVNFSEPQSIDEVIEQDQNVRVLTAEIIENMVA